MKVALICAFPAGSNTGMLSVDLSFDSLLSVLDQEIEITKFCPWKSFDKSDKTPLKYLEYKNTEQLDDFDHVIFWGDFLHWIVYAENDWYSRGKNLNPDLTQYEIVDLWYDLCLLENHQELQKKTSIIGGTLYGLKSEDFDNKRYMSALKNLYDNARLVMVRDFFSKYFLEQITENKIKVGGDCALLLDSGKLIATWPELENSRIDRPYLLYAFGRSGDPDILEKYADAIAEKFGIIPIRLDWLKKGTGIAALAQRLYLIKNAEFVITDIYHCAINSYREKKSIICIGKGASRIKGTLSDKKKEILHFQLFAQDRYRYLENISQNFNAEVNHAIEILKNNQNFKTISDLIDRQIKTTVLSLTKLLTDK